MTDGLDFVEVLKAAGDVAYDWDLAQDAIYWYGNWQALFSGDEPPKDSQALFHVLHPDDLHIFFSGEANTLNRQFRIKNPSLGILWIHERGRCDNASAKEKQPIRQRGIWRVIEQPMKAPIISEEPLHDGLTGCFKRHALHAQLSRMIENSKMARRVGAYLVIDVDKMSFVNEAIGAEGGDAVLRGVANRLAQIIPTRAILGRVGGDTFGVILPEPLGNDIEALADRIIDEFRNSPLIAANAPLHITVSIGGVRVPTVAKNANEAMIFAEQALHMAHQRGLNNFIEYIDSPIRVQENRQLLELTEQIKTSFKNSSFRLAYQPIVSADTAEPVCYEALVRMFGDDGKPIPAAAFVPTIEQLGLAGQLDRLVLQMAIRDMEAVPGLGLAVNISGFSASQPDFSDFVRRLLEHRPDVAKRLVIEITETAVLVDISATRRLIATLGEMGARVSLDDFGAGSTSIRYLRELGLSIMKIDKDLLQDVLTDHEAQHLVKVLIELAHGLGIQTVAEGIETQEAAAWLRNTPIDYMQGYFFGMPSLEIPGIKPAEAKQPETV